MFLSCPSPDLGQEKRQPCNLSDSRSGDIMATLVHSPSKCGPTIFFSPNVSQGQEPVLVQAVSRKPGFECLNGGVIRMGELWIGEQRFHNSQALEDTEWKTNSKSDGPRWNVQQAKFESMSLRAFAGYHAHISRQTTHVWVDMGQIFYYLIRNFV